MVTKDRFQYVSTSKWIVALSYAFSHIPAGTGTSEGWSLAWQRSAARGEEGHSLKEPQTSIQFAVFRFLPIDYLAR